MEIDTLRHRYIGAVALLCNLHSRLSATKRADAEVQYAMERLAGDFNASGFSVCMEKAGGGWGLFDRREQPVADGASDERVAPDPDLLQALKASLVAAPLKRARRE